MFLVLIFVVMSFLHTFTTKEINNSYTNAARNQLFYANESLAEKCSEIELLATAIMTNDTVRFFRNKINSDQAPFYMYIQDYKTITEYIYQWEFNSTGIDAIHIYWVEEDLIISTNSVIEVKEKNWIKDIHDKGKKWHSENKTLLFSTSYPYINAQASSTEYFVIIEMEESYLEGIREIATNIEGAEAFLKLPNGNFVASDESVAKSIDQELISGEKETNLHVGGSQVKVLSVNNPNNDVQIVSYFDTRVFLAPVFTINLLTFSSTFVILIVGFLIIYLFYRNILSHLDLLVRKFKKVENGELTTRIDEHSSNEFHYVFDQFNQMVSGVERLLKSLNNEYQRYDLAERKLLQSQINPHFLYNSLFYIVSSADNPEIVRKMSWHLGDYYRYRTKVKDLVLLSEEIDFSKSYLSIIAIRKSIKYKICVEEDLLDEFLLPLLIQPLLENAIIHGIEGKEGAKQVILSVYSEQNFYHVSVEDDGYGLNENERERLSLMINSHESKNPSVGLWNVNQRLLNYYGENSTLKISRSEKLGGFKVSFQLEKEIASE